MFYFLVFFLKLKIILLPSLGCLASQIPLKRVPSFEVFNFKGFLKSVLESEYSVRVNPLLSKREFKEWERFKIKELGST